MKVQHGTSVLVVDGRKALLLRNEGDGTYPDFRVIRKWEQELPPDRELKSQRPGRTFNSQAHGKRRSAYEETDFHQQAENDFASKAADYVNEQLQLEAIDDLIIVAPPITLGAIRKDLRRDLADHVVAEIDKDLVKHPVEAIAGLIISYPEPA